MTWAVARRYLESPFMYSGVLKNYCEESIWGDLQKRNFTSTMAILRLLTCNDAADEQVTAAALKARLSGMYTESQWLDALLWLEAVGLVAREAAQAEECYRLRTPLLGRWLRMQMGAAEVRQWQGQ